MCPPPLQLSLSLHTIQLINLPFTMYQLWWLYVSVLLFLLLLKQFGIPRRVLEKHMYSDHVGHHERLFAFQKQKSMKIH